MPAKVSKLDKYIYVNGMPYADRSKNGHSKSAAKLAAHLAGAAKNICKDFGVFADAGAAVAAAGALRRPGWWAWGGAC